MEPNSKDSAERTEIFVGACHPSLTEDEFVEFFEQFGKVHDYRLIRDKLTGKNLSTNFQGSFEDLVLSRLIQRRLPKK